MRVLHVDTALEARGGQRQLELLVRGLARVGVEQTLACPTDAPIRRLLPEVTTCPLRPGNHPANVAAVRALSSGFDVVAAHTSHAHFASLGSRCALAVHRRVDFSPKGLLSRAKYRRPDAFICVSQAVSGVLERAGVPSERLHVVYDGVAALTPAPPADLGDGPIVLAVGALVAHKDHATLALAAPGVPARIVVAGEGPLRDSLAGGPLELLGLRDDVAALFARADVFVHSSSEEGMGQVVVEAMLAGVPVVATQAGGVAEVVGDAGVLVPIGDHDALAAALCRVLGGDHPPRDRARDRAEQFSVERMVEGTLAIYRSIGGS